METPPPAAQSTLTLVLVGLASTIATLILGLGTLLVGKRLRRSSSALNEAQAKEAEAHAGEMNASAVTSLIDQLMDQAKERQQEAKYHAEQIRDDNATMLYQRRYIRAQTERGHLLGRELHRLNFLIVNRDVTLTIAVERIKKLQGLDSLPPAVNTELTELALTVTPVEFQAKSQEDVTKSVPLPDCPVGVEPMDSGEMSRPPQLK